VDVFNRKTSFLQPEQAIEMLRKAEVRLSQGEKIRKICRGLE